MIAALSLDTLVSAGLWMVIGLLIYFLYGRKRSKLKGQDNTESEEE
jgi:preprotein translocase subunit SecG